MFAPVVSFAEKRARAFEVTPLRTSTLLARVRQTSFMLGAHRPGRSLPLTVPHRPAERPLPDRDDKFGREA